LYAVRRTARVEHACSECQKTIEVNETYYSIVIGGGLGAMKFPHRVHPGCLGSFVVRYEMKWGVKLERELERKEYKGACSECGADFADLNNRLHSCRRDISENAYLQACACPECMKVLGLEG
jgi:hypothetical protein